MSQTLDFTKAILTEKKQDSSLEEGQVVLTYEDGKYGKVIYTRAKKSQETLEAERIEEEKQVVEEDPNYCMALAIIKMEIRRQQYRDQDIHDYGYDKYMEEYYYEPDPDSDEEAA